MKAKDLRNSILQLAVQGKLVSQDPNDEPASVLLERIRAERAQLIKEKKIKAPKNGESIIYRASDGSHYEKHVDARGHVLSERCIDDEIPFEIPESWEWVRLGALCVKVGSGSTPSGGRAIYKPEGAMLLRSQNVYNDGLRLDDVARFNYSLYNKRGSHVLPGDILLNITGASIGRSAIVPSVFGDADVNQHVLILRQIDKDINAYIHLFITSPVVQMAIMNVQVGATKEGLSAAKASNLLIPIAPCLEQERIVDRVENLVPCIAEYELLESARERLDSELPDRLRKSILQMAVEGKLVEQNPADEPASALLDRIRAERAKLIKEKKIKAPKGGESVIYRASDGGYYEKRSNGEPVCIDDEIPFEIPESWEWVRLGSLCSLLIGKTPARSEIKYWSNGSFPWVSISDMKQGEVLNKTKELVSAEAMASCFKAGLVPAGTLIMSFKLTIGRTCILGMDAVHNEAIISVQTTCDPGFTQRDYLAYQLPYLCTFGDSKDAIKGSTLNKDSLSNLLIPIPPLAEQQRIVERVDELMPPIDEQRRIADVVSNALRQFTNRQ